MVFNLPSNNRCPCLFDQRLAGSQLKSQHPGRARMLQKGQEHTIGLMILAQRVKTDAIIRAGRKHWMREHDLPVIENDDGNILEGYRHRFALFNGKRKMFPPQARRAGNHQATPAHGAAPDERDKCFRERLPRIFRA